MSDFIEAMKDDPIILGATIAVAVLILVILILIVTLIAGSRKEKKSSKKMQKSLPNTQLNQQVNNQMNSQYNTAKGIPNAYNQNGYTNGGKSYQVQPVQQPINNSQQPPINNQQPAGNYQQPMNYSNPIPEPINNNTAVTGELVNVANTYASDLIKQQSLSNLGSTGNETVELVSEVKEVKLNETVLLGEDTAAPSAYFTYEINRESKKAFINKSVVAIGREPESSDIVIDFDDHIGRKHALVYSKENIYVLVDLNSKNGTFINDERLQGERALKDGDRVKLASTELIFRID
jgi:hypothetical protein